MDVSEYRKRTLEELEADPTPPEDKAAAAGARAAVEDRRGDLDARITALSAIGETADRNPELIDRLIEVVRDGSESPELRIRAIEILQALAFQVVVFAPKRPRYLETLRSIVEDPDPKLRRRALAILARYKDEYAQRRLIEGLEHPSKALVPTAKAIQYLGYDIHADSFPLLRRIVEKPPTVSAQREAVRLLAADPSSKALLTRVLNDRGEPRSVRQMSALALQSVAPTQFEKAAREISLDDSEDDRLRATALGALARHGPPETTPRHKSFSRRVAEIQQKASSPQLRRASKSYIARRPQ
jgi:HEAT repeat protein